MLWETTEPHVIFMQISENSASLYYPKERLQEVYPVSGHLGSLAASPLPRIEALSRHFSFRQDRAAELDPAADDATHLALFLSPLDESLRRHLDHVRVLIDPTSGLIIRAEMTDPDGDRTILSFSNMRTNTDLDESDLTVRLPFGVRIVRPLEKLGGSPSP
jgi:hypothetical protein